MAPVSGGTTSIVHQILGLPAEFAAEPRDLLRQLPAEMQSGLQGLFGSGGLRALICLAEEDQVPLLVDGLMHLASRLEASEHLEGALQIFHQLLEANASGRLRLPSELHRQIEEQVDAIEGRGAVLPRLGFHLSHFFSQALDLPSLFAMGAAGPIFEATRAFALGRLALSPVGRWLGRMGTGALANTLAFGAESLSFTAINRLGNSLVGRRQDWGMEAIWQEYAGGAVTLLGLKITGGLASSAVRRWGSAATPASGLVRLLLPQAGMFAGILASHRLEEALGFREAPPDESLRYWDALATLFQFNFTGWVSQRLVGEHLNAMSRRAEHRADTLLGGMEPFWNRAHDVLRETMDLRTRIIAMLAATAGVDTLLGGEVAHAQDSSLMHPVMLNGFHELIQWLAEHPRVLAAAALVSLLGIQHFMTRKPGRRGARGRELRIAQRVRWGEEIRLKQERVSYRFREPSSDPSLMALCQDLEGMVREVAFNFNGMMDQVPGPDVRGSVYLGEFSELTELQESLQKIPMSLLPETFLADQSRRLCECWMFLALSESPHPENAYEYLHRETTRKYLNQVAQIWSHFLQNLPEGHEEIHAAHKTLLSYFNEAPDPVAEVHRFRKNRHYHPIIGVIHRTLAASREGESTAPEQQASAQTRVELEPTGEVSQDLQDHEVEVSNEKEKNRRGGGGPAGTALALLAAGAGAATWLGAEVAHASIGLSESASSGHLGMMGGIAAALGLGVLAMAKGKSSGDGPSDGEPHPLEGFLGALDAMVEQAEVDGRPDLAEQARNLLAEIGDAGREHSIEELRRRYFELEEIIFGNESLEELLRADTRRRSMADLREQAYRQLRRYAEDGTDVFQLLHLTNTSQAPVDWQQLDLLNNNASVPRSLPLLQALPAILRQGHQSFSGSLVRGDYTEGLIPGMKPLTVHQVLSSGDQAILVLRPRGEGRETYRIRLSVEQAQGFQVLDPVAFIFQGEGELPEGMLRRLEMDQIRQFQARAFAQSYAQQVHLTPVPVSLSFDASHEELYEVSEPRGVLLPNTVDSNDLERYELFVIRRIMEMGGQTYLELSDFDAHKFPNVSTVMARTSEVLPERMQVGEEVLFVYQSDFERARNEPPEDPSGPGTGGAIAALLAVGAGAATFFDASDAFAMFGSVSESADHSGTAGLAIGLGALVFGGVFSRVAKQIQRVFSSSDSSEGPNPVGDGPYRTLPPEKAEAARGWMAIVINPDLGEAERYQALQALVECNDPNILDALSQRSAAALVSPESSVEERRFAHDSLLSLGEHAVPALIPYLTDWSPSRQLRAVEFLYSVYSKDQGNTQVRDALIDLLERQSSRIVRTTLGGILKQLGNTGKMMIGMEGLRFYPQHRAAHDLDQLFLLEEKIALKIGEAADPRAVPFVIPLLDHPLADIRERAVSALGRMGGLEAIEALSQVLNRTPLSNFIPTSQTAPPISPSADPDAWLRSAAAVALGSTGDPRAILPLEQRFAIENDPKVRRDILEALQRLDAPNPPSKRGNRGPGGTSGITLVALLAAGAAAATLFDASDAFAAADQLTDAAIHSGSTGLAVACGGLVLGSMFTWIRHMGRRILITNSPEANSQTSPQPSPSLESYRTPGRVSRLSSFFDEHGNEYEINPVFADPEPAEEGEGNFYHFHLLKDVPQENEQNSLWILLIPLANPAVPAEGVNGKRLTIATNEAIRLGFVERGRDGSLQNNPKIRAVLALPVPQSGQDSSLAPQPQPSLVIDSESGQEISLDFTPNKIFLIGRNPLTSLNLTNLHISQYHAEISRSEYNNAATGEVNSFYYIRDLNSVNGTYQNGTRLPPIEWFALADGDEIYFANQRFIWRVASTN